MYFDFSKHDSKIYFTVDNAIKLSMPAKLIKHNSLLYILPELKVLLYMNLEVNRLSGDPLLSK
jgi:hypothetical protein